jgi:hypothetical protein
MDDLSRVVERLRAVREAERKFLKLWAVEQAVIVPGLDRVAADIESAALASGWEAPGIDGAGFGFVE